MEASGRERFRKATLRFIKKLEKTNPTYAKRVREKLDDIIKWYEINKRELTPQELRKILNGENPE